MNQCPKDFDDECIARNWEACGAQPINRCGGGGGDGGNGGCGCGRSRSYGGNYGQGGFSSPAKN